LETYEYSIEEDHYLKMKVLLVTSRPDITNLNNNREIIYKRHLLKHHFPKMREI